MGAFAFDTFSTIWCILIHIESRWSPRNTTRDAEAAAAGGGAKPHLDEKHLASVSTDTGARGPSNGATAVALLPADDGSVLEGLRRDLRPANGR